MLGQQHSAQTMMMTQCSPMMGTVVKEHKCSLTSSSPKFEKRHQRMYKTPPHWMKSYREKCKDELIRKRKDKQIKLLNDFRNIDDHEDKPDDDATLAKDEEIFELMQSIWMQFAADGYDADDDFDFQPYLDEIEKELSDEYESCLNIEEESLEWTVSTRNSVVCFFCQRNYLTLETTAVGSKIHCSQCPFFNLQLNITFTMDNLDERLQSLLEEHKQFGCDRPVSFRIANGDNNVFCLCSNCGYSKYIF